METILLVEDDRETRKIYGTALTRSGYTVENAGTVSDAIAFLSRRKPALMILDLVLPDGNGLEVCAWVRARPALAAIPVIALTGRDELSDKQAGFLIGVDQYLTKPIDPDEIVLWVNALLRRVQIDRSGACLEIGRLRINTEAQLIRYKERAVENLTTREFELFYALVKNSPKILSRSAIVSEVWRTVCVENLVDTHMYNLRKKLPKELGDNIQSVPGQGFRYIDKNS